MLRNNDSRAFVVGPSYVNDGIQRSSWSISLTDTHFSASCSKKLEGLASPKSNLRLRDWVRTTEFGPILDRGPGLLLYILFWFWSWFENFASRAGIVTNF